jgi:hypothetical protein
MGFTFVRQATLACTWHLKRRKLLSFIAWILHRQTWVQTVHAPALSDTDCSVLCKLYNPLCTQNARKIRQPPPLALPRYNMPYNSWSVWSTNMEKPWRGNGCQTIAACLPVAHDPMEPQRFWLCNIYAPGILISALESPALTWVAFGRSASSHEVLMQGCNILSLIFKNNKLYEKNQPCIACSW